MKLRIQIREPLVNMVYVPQIISDHITYNKQIIMLRKNGELRDFYEKILKQVI